MTTPLDLFGREIRPGDTVAYSYRAGNHASIGVYHVLDVHTHETHYPQHTVEHVARGRCVRAAFTGKNGGEQTLRDLAERAIVINEHPITWNWQ